MVSALEVWALSGGGGASSLFRTLQGLAARGHFVDFVGPRVGANHHFGAPALAPPEIPGVRYHLFDLPQPSPRSNLGSGVVGKVTQKAAFAVLFPFVAARAARKAAGNGGFDVFYGYELHGVLAGRLLRGLGLPRVARFQGTVMHPYLGNRLGLLRRYEEVLALRAPAELYIMTNDGTQGDEVLSRLNPGSADRTLFWRNGLDFDASRAPRAGELDIVRQRLGIRADELVLVTAVRLARWKRVDRAIDTLAEMRRRGVPARLLIVGDGEEKANLEKQAAALGLGADVKFVGPVPQAEVRSYLWAADVFLSLNELSNVGNPLLEAMSVGSCIVTIDVGDTGQVIKDGENGILLKSAEPADIAAAIGSLAADPEKRAHLGHAALAYAAANFWTWEERLDAEESALAGLLKGPRAPAGADV